MIPRRFNARSGRIGVQAGKVDDFCSIIGGIVTVTAKRAPVVDKFSFIGIFIAN